MKFVARHEGNEVAVEVERLGSGYQVTIGDRRMDIDLIEAGHFVHSLRFDDGRQFALVHERDGDRHRVTLGGRTLHVELFNPLALKRGGSDDAAGEGGTIRAMMPGRVVRLLVSPGEAVCRGAGLLILEAMKMENEIVAPADGILSAFFVKPGDTVEVGAELAHLES
jgi:3-methylcrotonyl-CoA carboxylase alpha subunit